MAHGNSLFWSVPVELGPEEKLICKRLERVGRLYRFLRLHRHELFDEDFQAELARMYSDKPRGTAPLPPAMLATVTLLQAYQQTSDAAAVQQAMFDRRWQMVLGCLGCERPPFSQGVLVDFRRRLIAHDLDRRLLDRTVEPARTTGDFGHKALRVALDSAPLRGAGRVEDTFNLIGHAMEVVVECAARLAGRTPEEVRRRAGTKLLGHSSVKAALDIDWDDRLERQRALERLLADATALRAWVSTDLAREAREVPLKKALELLARVIEQNIEPDPGGGGARIRDGVAADRVISITDGDMRHGRKSKSRVVNGFKRHIAADMDSGLILATTVRPANEPEYLAEHDIRSEVEKLGEVAELHIDRGYLAGNWPRDLWRQGRDVLSKPWPRRPGERFSKADFVIDFEAGTVTCPAGTTAAVRPPTPSAPGGAATFPAAACRACHLRAGCVSPRSGRGRQLVLHRAEPLLRRLREMKATGAGRARLRERVAIEHRLAHFTRRQGPRARYVGLRKNLFDARRTAAVENLHRVERLRAA